MTELLYQTDSYLKEFDATVTRVTENGVVLDRTAFYPQGGGQPFDTGTLVASAKEYKVIAVRKDGDDVVHEIEGELPSVETAVHGIVDWDRRYTLMLYHTALHVLCGVVFREFGALVTGGNMATDHARMDFELEDMDRDRIAYIESKANEVITEGHKVNVRILPRAEAFEIPDLIRTKINLLPRRFIRANRRDRGLGPPSGRRHPRRQHERSRRPSKSSTCEQGENQQEAGDEVVSSR